MNSQQEIKDDIKLTGTNNIVNSQDNCLQSDATVKSVKTFPKAFQLSKLNTMKSAQTNKSGQVDSSPIRHFPKSSDVDFVRDYRDKENELEDEHSTEEWFIKITIDEMVSFLFSALSIGNGIIYYEVRTCGKSCSDKDQLIQTDAIFITLLMSSISLFFYLLSMVVKYYHYFKLHRCAKYIQQDDSFFKSDLWKSALVEFIFAFFHPNLIFKDNYCTTGKEWNLIEVGYNVNDFLLVISLFRMFDWIRIAMMQTSFYCARADRVCKMMGIQLSFLFSIKCLLINNTMEMQFGVTLIVITSLGYMLKVIEGAVFDLASQPPYSNNFSDFGSCIWYIFVTMTTVGYGDYSTGTFLGRIITVLIGIIGTILVAFNINFFQSQTQLDEGEKHSLELISRLEGKEEIVRVAAKYFKTNAKYFLAKNKLIRGDIPNNDSSMKRLLKLAKKKVTGRKKFNSILHQFQVEFKASSGVDSVKKRIGELEKYIIKSDEKIENIEKALESLLTNDV